MSNRQLSNEPEEFQALATWPVTAVPMGQIVAGAFKNVRKYDPKGIASLAGSIKLSGLDTPLIIAPLTEEQLASGEFNGALYGVVDGSRRFAALQKLSSDGLDIPEVMAKVVGNDVRTRLVKANTANHQREGMDYIETATNIKAMQEDGMKLADIALAVGHPATWCSGAVALLSLRPEVQKKVAEGLPWRVCKVLPTLDEGEQDALLAKVEAIMNGEVKGETVTEAADTAATKRKKKSKRGQPRKEDKETGRAGPLTGKKALLLIEEQQAELKTVPTMENTTEKDVAHAKSAGLLLSMMSKFIGGKLGAVALRKKLVKFAAGEEV